MATYEHNALMQYIDETGNIHINYPATKAEIVMIGDSDVQTEINARAKTSDVLYTLEEISACTNFTNKISGAEAVDKLNSSLESYKNWTTAANVTKIEGTKSITIPSDATEILMILAGEYNITRLSQLLPLSYVKEFNVASHQINAYIDGLRIYGHIQYIGNEKYNIGLPEESAFIDRMIILYR